MAPTLNLPFKPEQRTLAMQVARYAVAGLGITLAFSASYWAVTEVGGIDPNLSLAIVFVVFTGISYFAHGAFSFRDHGARDRMHIRATRFLIVNLIGFGLNQLFVWLLVKHFGGPTWWPIIPFVLVTPWVSFALHRKWVFA